MSGGNAAAQPQAQSWDQRPMAQGQGLGASDMRGFLQQVQPYQPMQQAQSTMQPVQRPRPLSGAMQAMAPMWQANGQQPTTQGK